MMTNIGTMTHVKRGLLYSRYDCVADFVTLRGGDGEFSICDYTGDNPEHTAKCLQALASELGVEPDCIIWPRQVHSCNLRVLDDYFFTLDSAGRKDLLNGVDGMITSRQGIVIGVHTADCVPVLLHSFEGVGMVAAVHAGWRGTLAGITARAVMAMREAGATGIAASIGVSICSECFEVGDEVADAFVAAGYRSGIITRNPVTGKAHIDLKEANRRQLLDCGVNAKDIFVSASCTRHDTTGQYYSVRRMGATVGRTFSGIMLAM